MGSFGQLKPAVFWKWFETITQIPRPSGKEEIIIQTLLDFAKLHRLECKKDSAGNIIIMKHATPGFEGLKKVVLQAHLDMVCEKNSDVDHDFENDPIQCMVENGWVKASGTTLGADDGVGVATMLAILDSTEIAHGPLECLFTVDEERGLSGARLIQPGFISGDILINLDSGDEGEFYTGCAGGMDTTGSFEFSSLRIPVDHCAFKIIVKGLTGGHSGEDIDKGLANSVKIVNRLIWHANRKFPLGLAMIDAGNQRNAIPREGYAIITLPCNLKKDLVLLMSTLSDQIRTEFTMTESAMVIETGECRLPEFIIDLRSKEHLLSLLYAIPHGVITMSHTIKGLVETSTNLASVKFQQTNHQIFIATSQRSSVNSAKEDIGNQVKCIFELAGFSVEQSTGYPGWTPNPDSEILLAGKNVYRNLFGKDPLIKAVHAGLECGLFLEKSSQLDMISIGPTMKGCHSPEERLEIESVEKFWSLLIEILKSISNSA